MCNLFYLHILAVRYMRFVCFSARSESLQLVYCLLYQASTFRVRQRLEESTTDGIKAMDSIRMICDDPDLDDAICFAYGPQFLNFEGNRVRQSAAINNASNRKVKICLDVGSCQTSMCV